VRVIFAGTPLFAEQSLVAIHAAGFEIPLVLTQPDRPAGRGKALRASAVKQTAVGLGLKVLQPESLKAAQVQQTIAEVDAQVMVVAAYGLILPKAVLEIPSFGCLNIHASLLPRWRGAAPIQRAIQAGDTHTGITIMQMDVGLDTGPMISQKSIEIAETASAALVHDELALLGATMIVQSLQYLAQQGKPLVGVIQPTEGVTYAAKLEKTEATIDWTASATTIMRKVHAFDPVPGSTARLQAASDEVLKIWKVRADPAKTFRNVLADIGKLRLDENSRVFVTCGCGELELLEIQRPGGKRISAQVWLSGQTVLKTQTFVVN
jgi:methionyl-tRNA formyltransferase